MATSYAPPYLRTLHPLHAIFLAFALPMFLGALVSDIAYSRTFQIQWANFSAWLIAGGLFFTAFAILWALVDLFRFRRSGNRRPLVYFLVLLVMWVLAFVNALVHAKDAWATMPEGLYLSVITTLLALVAAWVGYSRFTRREMN